ncbi:3-dehydroquinate synthase [Syntrophomonas zehnderi OL-4]|uniref:3-dehydroquinate synthase n=1 Tax=Syntrophomonas zehnderi OL-4 TaxID=690567 RepID=A0A0E4C8Z1_9FIRM|nr:3-dehydroquinate synthase II [Syntrophomonas zehnderi]CFX77961.1 3-dehydroquinate synthase [Syntrophomonas zehnderi OL-4]
MGNLRREIWFNGRDIPFERQDIWGMVNQSAIRKVVVSYKQRQEGYFPQKTEFITEINTLDELAGIPNTDIVLSASQELLESARLKGYKTCAFFSIHDSHDLEKSWQEAANYDYAIVDFDLPTNIPLELILARLQDNNTIIVREAPSFVDAEVAFGVLEKGSDAVLYSGDDITDIKKIIAYLTEEKPSHINLLPLRVTEVQHVGMGLRSCIDTTGLMTQDEGMLVGSTSGGGIFVCSETHYLPYMNLRPFRVNAGAVHSYIWMPNETAEYLTDLKAGSRVLCVNTSGEIRELTVGRIKTEVRPLLLIKGEADGRELNVIVQDDWHIRLMGADGKPKNATKIKPGDELLAYLCEPGRHVGIKVGETILEK